ncbi:MAG TPA: PfkB family carbohydrate kinase [Phycisphaerae bacterium]|nr:PfkB family carbohydrate kinase [Phycisphaerae bacterium]
MSLIVVGSVAFDTVETPAAKADRVLGGSATYFSYAASFFGPVRLVGVVGTDFPPAYRELLQSRNIDTAGLETVEGKTFFWRGAYEKDMNKRTTLEVDLNVFGEFDPTLPEHFRDSRFVFLANGSPRVQMRVLEQVARPQLVVADTMNFYIESQRDDLLKLMRRIDGMVLNDEEAFMLTGASHLVDAGRKVLAMGPKFVVIKKGEHGAMLVTPTGVIVLPAYPTDRVVDPTGAGDSFAGGMMGYLATQEVFDEPRLRRAMAYGTVVASFGVEGFSLDRFRQIGMDNIRSRYEQYRAMLAL